MRILFAGAWQYEFYEAACTEPLNKLGVEVVPFSWASYFRSIPGKVQLKWVLPGPAVARLNRDLLAKARQCQPDAVLVWRGTHILPKTLRAIRQGTDALLVSYNNDDPFCARANPGIPLHQKRLWHYFLKDIPEYDLHLVYRPVNLDEIKRAGGKEAHVLMPYFIPSLHRPMQLTEEEKGKFGCEVVFVGHYEPEREIYLRELVKAGLHVKLFGPKDWTKKLSGPLADYFGEIRPAWGSDYAKAICGAKMCLNFFSHLNRDTWNRRCFEIAGSGGLLVSKRTADLQTIFREGEEAVFFSSPDELVERVLWLREHEDAAKKIAEAGRKRVIEDGHSLDDRMRMAVGKIERALSRKRA